MDTIEIFKITLPHTADEKRKRVAAYCRVSTERRGLGHSLEAQTDYYTGLIRNNTEWDFAGIYADSFVSGTETSKRTEFRRLIADCDKGLIDIILCKSISRFSRNTVDLLEAIRHLKSINVDVRFEKENISSMTSEGELMLTVFASFSQEESRNISENIKWAIHKGYEKGKVRNTLCYGFRVVNGRLVIQENEAETVRKIFKWYLEGDSCYVIKNRLNAAGVPSYHGSKFTTAVISSMLRQEKYAGNCLLQKYYSQSYMTHKEVKNKGELPMYLVEGSHDPIVPKEVFDAVQAEISKRYGVAIVNGIAEKDEYLNRPKGSKAAVPSYPRRKCVIPEEQKKAMSKYFSERENCKALRYDLSMFIKCETCGQNLTAKKKKFTDGTEELWWECFKHSRVSPETPRPKVMQDAALKKQIVSVLEIPKFSKEIMEQRLTHISVAEKLLTFHFRSGNDLEIQYIPCKRHNSRKDI